MNRVILHLREELHTCLTPAPKRFAFFSDRYSIDPAIISSLLSVALSRGGDFADSSSSIAPRVPSRGKTSA